MKKLLIACLTLGLALSGTFVSATETSKIDQLLELQPGLSREELMEGIEETAKSMGTSETEVIDLALNELEQTIAEEQGVSRLRGGSSGNRYLTSADRKGDIFYTPSSTLGIQHGHVGIYYAKNRIVESIPSTGVRNITHTSRNVENHAVMQLVNTTQAKRNAAADWANSRVGKDAYSYNFVTNRQTAHTGAKNCSKLLWSAYIQKAGIDIDRNGGTGVYPIDIRDSSYTRTYKVIL